MFNIFKKRKIQFVILAIVILTITLFVVFHDSEIRGELYPTSTQGLEVAKASEMIEIDLGEIKATKGNVNYDIPEGTDLEKYNKVLVWCVPFRVLFSYSDLN